MRYAAQTEVPVEKSKAEIEQMLVRYKATSFVTGWNADSAMVEFRLRDLSIRFILPLPDRNEERFKKKIVRNHKKALTQLQSERAYEQEVRQRWRALNLVVKAKLEAVETGISTLEKEFLAFIVIPGGNGVTIGDWVIENAIPAIKKGHSPLALAPKKTEEVDDAEILPDSSKIS